MFSYIKICTITRPVFFALLAILVSGCTGTTHTIRVGDESRGYRLYIPDNLSVHDTVPLLLAFHQFSDTARGMERMTGFNTIADREGFIVVYPQGKRRMWNSGMGSNTDDLAFIDALLEHLVATYPVNPVRIYATGASAGAMMIQYYACHRDRFAAIAPVMGPMRSEMESGCERHLPVLYMHGIDDPVIPYEGGLTDAGPGSSVVFLSAEATAAFWARNNDCNGEPEMSTTTDNVGNQVAIVYRYLCEPNRETLLYAVPNCGHTWPGGRNRYPQFIVGQLVTGFDASQAIWEFFSRHARHGDI